MDASVLMASLFFGTLGTAMLVFGKRAGRLVPIGSGIALMVLPCVIPGAVAMTIVCALVAAVPFFVRY